DPRVGGDPVEILVRIDRVRRQVLLGRDAVRLVRMPADERRKMRTAAIAEARHDLTKRELAEAHDSEPHPGVRALRAPERGESCGAQAETDHSAPGDIFDHFTTFTSFTNFGTRIGPPRTFVRTDARTWVEVMNRVRPSAPPKVQLEIAAPVEMRPSSRPSGARTWIPPGPVAQRSPRSSTVIPSGSPGESFAASAVMPAKTRRRESVPAGDTSQARMMAFFGSELET